MRGKFPLLAAERGKAASEPSSSNGSLSALVEDWWKEAKAAGRKHSTYESYQKTMMKLVACLKYDEAGRVTPEDIVRFKDHRLQGASWPSKSADESHPGPRKRKFLKNTSGFLAGPRAQFFHKFTRQIDLRGAHCCALVRDVSPVWERGWSRALLQRRRPSETVKPSFLCPLT